MNFPTWKQQLISSYLDGHHYKSLAKVIQNKEYIIIATNGSKSEKVSGEAWVITDRKRIILVEVHNPNFGNIKRINSHRSEIFGVLSNFVFVNEYCKYFQLKLNSEVKYYGDNLAVINKTLDIKQQANHYDNLYKKLTTILY